MWSEVKGYKINIEIKNVCAYNHKVNKNEERVKMFTNSSNYCVCVCVCVSNYCPFDEVRAASLKLLPKLIRSIFAPL